MKFETKNMMLTAAALLGLAAATGSGGQAQAMTLHNCTGWDLPVHLQDKTGSVSRTGHLVPNGSTQIHATASYGPYRIILPTLGPGAHFSGRNGDGTFSLIKTGGGNIGIRNGNVCETPVSPVRGISAGTGSELCVKNEWGLQVCLRP